ncbi:MAG: hypothetical protein EB060_10995, partial [Proteobacteria bacterium]|nr:hypothetical protein [Pseudomonadota bacterium]
MDAAHFALHLARLIVSGWGVHSAAVDLADHIAAEGQRIGNPASTYATVRVTPLQLAVLEVMRSIQARSMSAAARALYQQHHVEVFWHIERIFKPLFPSEPVSSATLDKPRSKPPKRTMPESFERPLAIMSIERDIRALKPPMQRQPEEPPPEFVELARPTQPYSVQRVAPRYVQSEDSRPLPRFRWLGASEESNTARLWFTSHNDGDATWERRLEDASDDNEGAFESVYVRFAAVMQVLLRAEKQALKQEDSTFPDNALLVARDILFERLPNVLSPVDSAYLEWVRGLPTSRTENAVKGHSWYGIVANWADLALADRRKEMAGGR